jgi:geranylgeranyl diphosphate synthase type II
LSTPDNSAFRAQAALLRERTEQALERRLPATSLAPQRLHTAMRYACLGGGKRVRALLVFGAAQVFGVSDARLDGAACAVELIHAYSLVHDDMPSMDDDDLRRGKPTVHKAYDEATALLVGDALQTLAFEVLTDDDSAQITHTQRVAMIKAMAQASGSLGMAGGQAVDLQAVGQSLNLEEFQCLHRMKTGALIRTSVRLGALAAGATEPAQFAQLEHFADCIGLAFQIRDDVLDVEASTAALGKQQGADAALGKPTYPALLGLQESKARAELLYHEGLEALSRLEGDAQLLRDLAHFVVARGN